MLIPQNLNIAEAGGVINGDMNLVVPDAIGAPLLPVASVPVTHIAGRGQGFNVDVDQFSWPLPYVALNGRYGLQISQSPESESEQTPADGGKGCLEQPSDVLVVRVLAHEYANTQHLLKIERPSLCGSDTASIRQRD